MAVSSFLSFALMMGLAYGNFPCPTLFNFYPDTYDCTKFYRCNWGKAAPYVCPAGTRWSQSLLTCDHADNVPCHKTPALKLTYDPHYGYIKTPDPHTKAPDFTVDYDPKHNDDYETKHKDDYDNKHNDDYRFPYGSIDYGHDDYNHGYEPKYEVHQGYDTKHDDGYDTKHENDYRFPYGSIDYGHDNYNHDYEPKYEAHHDYQINHKEENNKIIRKYTPYGPHGPRYTVAKYNYPYVFHEGSDYGRYRSVPYGYRVDYSHQYRGPTSYQSSKSSNSGHRMGYYYNIAEKYQHGPHGNYFRYRSQTLPHMTSQPMREESTLEQPMGVMPNQPMTDEEVMRHQAMRQQPIGEQQIMNLLSGDYFGRSSPTLYPQRPVDDVMYGSYLLNKLMNQPSYSGNVKYAHNQKPYYEEYRRQPSGQWSAMSELFHNNENTNARREK